MPDPSQMDLGDLSSGMGGFSGGYKGTRKPFADRKDLHPAVRQYDNVVNVVGEDDE